MRFKSKIAALCATLSLVGLLAACDINPKSPVLAGDTGESSNEEIGTILPDPPPEHSLSPKLNDEKQPQPDMETPTPRNEQAPEKGPE